MSSFIWMMLVIIYIYVYQSSSLSECCTNNCNCWLLMQIFFFFFLRTTTRIPLLGKTHLHIFCQTEISTATSTTETENVSVCSFVRILLPPRKHIHTHMLGTCKLWDRFAICSNRLAKMIFMKNMLRFAITDCWFNSTVMASILLSKYSRS